MTKIYARVKGLGCYRPNPLNYQIKGQTEYEMNLLMQQSNSQLTDKLG